MLFRYTNSKTNNVKLIDFLKTSDIEQKHLLRRLITTLKAHA